MERGESNHEKQGIISSNVTGETIEFFQEATNNDTYLAMLIMMGPYVPMVPR